ncbi:MAG: AAA family ATPase [Planctomycetia bacterium]|nr:AAA family ATPase [Planctomycetia bacterium]
MHDVEAIQKVHQAWQRVREQAGKIIVGQAQVLEELFLALLSGGHCLLEGVPGLGKTLMVRTLASALSLEFQRIQCTPDLMPSDITGSEMLGEKREMKFFRGPVFTNILLADEINRTPPRTQSALLEAMQERQVTVGRERYPLPSPFFVLATQNPIEQEGTYPLPEAQLDRFLFKSRVTYPSRQEELDILLQTTGERDVEVTPVLDAQELLEILPLIRRVPIAGNLAEMACDWCRKTRPETDLSGELAAWIREYVAWGAGPRAGQSLILGAKARAVLNGRYCVEAGDLRAIAPAVLRHRIKTRFTADAQGITPDDVVRKILETPSQGA